LLGVEQLLLFFSLRSVAGVKHITDVVSTSLGDDRAVPVVEMLVVIQDWIGIATNALFRSETPYAAAILERVLNAKVTSAVKLVAPAEIR